VPTGNLPQEAKKDWEKVYENAKKNCPKDGDCEEYAAKVAWAAIKKMGWKKEGDKWVRNSGVIELSLVITKASYDKVTGRRNWRAVTSDTDEDLYGDNMSLELFEDFISRIESKEAPPEPFCSDYWCGDIPYLSIAHYLDLGGNGVPGKVEKVYIDGKKLKATGYFYNNALGDACFRSICDDLYGEKKFSENKVRVSIAFIDWKHRHKINNKVFERKSLDDICPYCIEEVNNGTGGGKQYLKGHLIHFALTRVPVNERTWMEVEKSMAIKTRKEDAASIVGEDLAEELEELSKGDVNKSLVVKAEVEEKAQYDDHDTGIECEEGDKECVEKQEEAKAEEITGKSAVEDVLPEDNADTLLGDTNAALDDDDNVGLDTGDALAIDTSEVYEAKMKIVDGKPRPAGDFLVVEDPDKPSTWHLPVRVNGKLSRRLMGAAKAALTDPQGFRGNKYSGPKKAEAVRKLKKLYEQEGMEWKSLVEKAYPEYVADTYKPYGGATSLREAVEFAEAQDEALRLSQIWIAFQSVIENIYYDEGIEDKSTAILAATEEFKDMIADKEASIYKSLLEAKQTKQTSHPLEEKFNVLRAAYDAAVVAEDKEEALREIQAPFEDLGKYIVDSIRENANTEQTELSIDDKIAKSVAEAVSSAFAPIQEQLSMLLAKSNTANVVTGIPQRRSIDPAVVGNRNNLKQKSDTPKLRDQVERSLGMTFG